MQTQTYTISNRVDARAPSEYKQHARLATRREAGNKLLELLEQQKLPAVVDIEEGWKHIAPTYGFEPDQLFEIRLSFTPVQHHHVTMASYDFPDFAAPNKRLHWTLRLWAGLKNLVGLGSRQ